MMKPLKYILILNILLAFNCKNEQKGVTTNQLAESKVENDNIFVSKAQFENAEMQIGSLQEQHFAQKVHTTGIIDVPPQSKAIISAFSGGYVKHTPLIIGDRVKKGERLVTIENPEFIQMQQNYLETTEQLTYLKSEYERQKTMYEENITSQKNFLKAESEYKIAIARANGLKKNLQMLHIQPASVLEGNIVSQVNIYSPISGYVTEVLVNTGSYVSPADKIMEIINTDHMHLELNIFEKDLLKIKKGQDIFFKVPEASQAVFKGDLHLVGTTIDAKSRIALVHGHIDENKENNFNVGMFVEADIITSTFKQLALPEDAVVEHENKHYVLLVDSEDEDGYQLHPLEVEIENNYNGYTSFKTTLPLDRQYLVKGGFVLLQAEDTNGH